MPHKSRRMTNGPGSDLIGQAAYAETAALGGAAGGSSDVDRRAVERVLAGIKEAGVQQVELQFADVTGAVKTVAVPARRIAAGAQALGSLGS